MAVVGRDYDWSIPQNCPVEFATSGNRLTDNLRLRQRLHEVWRENAGDRVELGAWYVRDWGGVRRNSEETIRTYVMLLPDLPERMKGVATWSKLATLANPSRFAIYDARVAFSLNALQLLNHGSIVERFPIPLGRNTTIEAAIKRRGLSRVRHRDRGESYLRFLQIVTSVGGELQRNEMALFAAAENLARALDHTRPATPAD